MTNVFYKRYLKAIRVMIEDGGFAPKYRRKVFFDEKRAEIREILRKLCQ